MFEGYWVFVVSIEMVFLGFICFASGCFKSGYSASVTGIFLLSVDWISRQKTNAIELLTTENVAALTLLFTLFVVLPFVFLIRGRRKAMRGNANCLVPEIDDLAHLRR